jgi:LmbE family N-acetylglucosaminyl deacetylase
MLAASLGAPGAPLRILCLGAHCDDIEIGCGGALLRLLAEHPGSTVHYAVFASTPERGKESRGAAAELLSGAARAEVEIFSFRESFFPYQGAAIKEQFEELKRKVQPDVVFTHHLRDLH